MRETVTQKEFLKFVQGYKELMGADDCDAVVSFIDKNITDGEPYKAYVHLDKGRQKEIAGYVQHRNEWFVDGAARTAVDNAEKCAQCGKVLKKRATVNGRPYCLVCLGGVLYQGGLTTFHTAD